MLDAAISAAQQLFSLGPLTGILIMMPIALFSGLMPGGGLPITIVVLGFAPYIDPWISVTVVVFAMAGNDITEPIPSILMGIPGSRSAQATILDGHPMARKGLAGVALGASYTCTLVGGLFGALALLLALPVAREFLRLFGAPEFFLLSLMGILSVAVVSAGAFVKGMLTAALGLAIAMIGSSRLTGDIRATFGIEYLWDGFNLAPIVVGLFALPEVIDLVTGDTPIARERVEKMLGEARRDVYRGMAEAFQHKWLLFRTALIGTFIGMMPGIGGSVAHWISYAHARHTEKNARQTFGTGDIRGVIASDTPNNSSAGGELIPTVVFGIPGSGGMAILLAILVLSGVEPGPAMLTTHLDLTISLVYTLVLACTIVVPVVLYFAPMIVRIAAVPPNILAPVVVAFVTLAAYMGTYSLGDLAVVLGFGVLGVFMKAYGWPRPPILIAAVLGPIVEKYLWHTLNTYSWEVFARPQFLTIFFFMAAVIFLSLRVQRDAKRAMLEASESTDEPALHIDRPEPTDRETSRSLDASRRQFFSFEVIGELLLLTAVGFFFIYVVYESVNWSLGAQLIPLFAVAAGTPFLLMRIAVLLLPGSPAVSGQIMDIGFRLDGAPGAGRRFWRIVGYVLLLYLSIWLFGFHLALPIGTFLYLLVYGRIGPIRSAVVALLFLGLMVGVYDDLLHAYWPQALIADYFGWDFWP